MATFNSFDDYDAYLRATLAPWPPARRTALAAAMAERWLPAYQQFSSGEDWGNPRVLRQALDAVWDTLSSRLARVDWKRLSRQVHDVTPHMDDFDANEALCACVMVQYAVQCCTEKDNLVSTVMGVESGLEAVSPDMLTGERVPARQWRQAIVGREIQKQLRLVEKVQALPDISQAAALLRDFLAAPEQAGEIAPKMTGVPKGPTNRQAYEQYQKIIQADIKSAARGRMDPRQYPEMASSLYLAEWLGRYSRRKQFLTGEYGRLEDQTALNLLLAKNRARDQAETGQPGWDPSARQMIHLFYQNPYNGMDVHALESPHSYGPSLRRLWVEAKRRGLPDGQVWEEVSAWARRQPEGWSKKPRLAGQEYLDQAVAWQFTQDIDLPWTASVNGTLWQVRLNDFPDEIMYTLLVNGQPAGDFHDWPEAWQRP